MPIQELPVSTNPARERIHPFECRGVRLLAGRFQRQFQQAVDYYLGLPDDDLLYGFRERAGQPHPGRELGGWYSNDGTDLAYARFEEIFHAFGQYLAGYARMYAVTGDDRIRQKVAHLVQEWGKTIEPDGYFFYSRKCNAFHYVYDKMMGGLVDCYLYAGITEVLPLMHRITDWAEVHLSRQRNPATPASMVGTTEGDPTDNEWYTLSENLYRAYLVTGDARFKAFAAEWHYTHYWEGVRRGDPEALRGLHGYSHVNNLSGAAAAYEVLGQEHYLETITRAYDLFREYQMMASGGYAPGESLSGPAYEHGPALEHDARSFEVPCGCWAGFKLTRYLMTLTGQACYGDWVESLLYNALGAVLPMKDEGDLRGFTYYYADYRVTGGEKVYHPYRFPCCSGTYPQVVADIHNVIYFHDEGGIYVNLFLPSELRHQHGGQEVGLVQRTDFPETNTSELTLACDSELELAIRIRVPGWIGPAGVRVTVNGEVAGQFTEKGSWASVRRTWKNGDRIGLEFDFPLSTRPVSPLLPHRAALMAGPVMLALRAEQGGKIEGDLGTSAQWRLSAGDQPLHYNLHSSGAAGGVFVPFYEIGEHEKYFVYHDLPDNMHHSIHLPGGA